MTFGTKWIAAAEGMMRTLDTEQITYTPAGEDARTILAIVDRDVAGDVGGPGEAVIRPDISIEVLNRATAYADDGFGGISSAELDTGGDTVTLARRIGETARVMRVAQLLGQDEAMLTLEVR